MEAAIQKNFYLKNFSPSPPSFGPPIIRFSSADLCVLCGPDFPNLTTEDTEERREARPNFPHTRALRSRAFLCVLRAASVKRLFDLDLRILAVSLRPLRQFFATFAVISLSLRTPRNLRALCVKVFDLDVRILAFLASLQL